MARRPVPRHARPRGRGALESAYSALVAELSEVRSDRYADHLELTRLTAMVDGLSAAITRLSLELAEIRAELRAARAVAPVDLRDPVVEMLADQASDLRATVAAQQASLNDLTARIVELLSRAAPETPEPAAQAVAPHPPNQDEPRVRVALVPPAGSYPALEPETSDRPGPSTPERGAAVDAAAVDAAPGLEPTGWTPAGWSLPPGTEPAPGQGRAAGADRRVEIDARGAAVLAGASSRTAVRANPAPVGTALEREVDEDTVLDDATLMRLRLIRQTFEA